MTTTSSPSGALVRCEAITKVFGDGPGAVTAVDGVSLTLHAGELVALVGPSGSGKTTVLSMLGALLRPTSGQVWLGEAELSSLAERDRTALRATQVGFVFQTAGLVPYLTAGENVALAGELAGWPRRRARERAHDLLAQLGLDPRIRHLPQALSGGEQQRVSVARAVLGDPVLVLADEPTAHLDRERGEEVMRLIVDAIERGERAGLVATHDDRVAAQASRVVPIVDGRLGAEAATQR